MHNFLLSLRQRYATLIAIVGGLLYPLAFAPYGWYWLMPLAGAMLLASWFGRTPRQAAFNGFAFGFAAYISGVNWVTISMQTGGAPWFLAMVLMFALVMFLAAYYALFAYAFMRWQWSHRGWAWMMSFASIWMLLEWLRGWLLSGFGWLAPGYAQIDSVLLGYFPIGGVLLVGWIVALTTASVFLFMLSPTLRSTLNVVAAACLWVLGLAFVHVHWTDDNGSTLTVSMVQASIAQEKKWLPEMLRPTIDLHLELSKDHYQSDLIMWPEAAIPLDKTSLESLWQELRRIAKLTDTQFLVGTVGYDRAANVKYNSVTTFGQNEQVYRKRHLVPFGETFPVPQFVKNRMRLMNLPYQNFSAGKDGQPPLDIAGQRVSMSICYEDVFGHEMLDSVADSTIMANVSNDAWFGGSLAPHQHLQISRVRAAEVGRYLLRSTNNGISAVINRYGRIVEQSPQFVPFVLTAEVPGTVGVTPYTRWGDWPIVLFCGFYLGLTIFRRS